LSAKNPFHAPLSPSPLPPVSTLGYSPPFAVLFAAFALFLQSLFVGRIVVSGSIPEAEIPLTRASVLLAVQFLLREQDR
jgi:hypothetical protein